MKNEKVFIARTTSVLVFLVGGAFIQIGLWRTPGDGWVDALTRHPYLWFVYMLCALLAGEHVLRWLKR